jgi:hypothetical protein
MDDAIYGCRHGSRDASRCVPCWSEFQKWQETTQAPPCAAHPWIPLSEQLPPLEKHVLVYGHGHGRTPQVMRLCDVTSLHGPDYKGPRRLSFYPGGRDPGWITHWAPLSAPPGQKLEWCAE